jgi:hypothetical protein
MFTLLPERQKNTDLLLLPVCYLCLLWARYYAYSGIGVAFLPPLWLLFFSMLTTKSIEHLLLRRLPE